MDKNNQAAITELLNKGVENIYPSREFLEKALKSGKKLTIYQGFDPTANTLHIGNAVGMVKLKQFQDLGHQVIFLIGDYTAMIGDPDKRTARKPLTRKEILNNCKDYKSQAEKILRFHGRNKVQIKYNSQWLSKLSFADTLELLSNFTVQRMLERDLFEERIKSGNPLYIHEFMYPVMQAYDCVAMDVDGELGGNDQTFNMLTGRDLMKQLKQKEKIVISMKLLEDPNGNKMGKTEGNMVRLDDSPKEMFGKVMSWPDGVISVGFEICTFMSMDEIKSLKNQIKSNPRDMKARLAREIVTIYHGEKAAYKAEKEFTQIFSKGENPDDMPEVKIEDRPYSPIEIINLSGFGLSNSEARRLIQQNAVKINEELITDIQAQITIKNNSVLRIGKRKFTKLVK